MIHSCLVRSDPGDRLYFHVIDAGLLSSAKSAIERMCSTSAAYRGINWLTPQWDKLEGLPTRAGLPREAFLRLLLGDQLPAELPRILWLDTDIVVEASLAAMWRENLRDNTIAAVVDFGCRTLGECTGTSQT